MTASTTAQKLQLLADALALEFSQSLASTQCAGALKRLLPGLEYLSIAVANPAQAGSIVASANCAAEGPTTLHLHDLLSSAAGLALQRGQPLQASLVGNGAAKVLPAWTDVQQMAAAAPGVTHLLCVPFGCDSVPSGAAPACEVHAGSGNGVLLFGLVGRPELDDRRTTMLALLARCLPAPMARLSADTLAFVNFACGNNAQCSCCCHDSEEEEEESLPASACGDDRHSGDGDGGAPSQALRVPRAHSPPAGRPASPPQQDRAGPSSQWWDDPSEGKASGKAVPAAVAPASPGALPEDSQPGTLPFRFSKALVAAAGEGAGVAAQNALTLAFRSPLMEREYGRWLARHHLKVDLLFSLLLAAALAIVSFVRPYRLVDLNPSAALLGLGMLLPLALFWASRALYSTWRDRVIVVMRLYVVAFVNLVSLRHYQGDVPPERLQQWVTFWMLTGAESLCVTALGFPIRMQLHLPLQFAAMGAAAWNLPRMCQECYPEAEAGACFKSSAAMAAVCGYALPTLALRYVEQRSRGAFVAQLRAATAHEA